VDKALGAHQADPFRGRSSHRRSNVISIGRVDA